MSDVRKQYPDYALDEVAEVTERDQLRAMTEPLRATILDLVLERAATVTELSEATGRPKSTVAHHVQVLVRAGMLRVVRTRKVRAIEERFYGRTARLFLVGALPNWPVTAGPPCVNDLAAAAAESADAHHADRLFSVLRHARIPRSEAALFWRQVIELVAQFSQLEREGDTVYGLAVGLYPTEHPVLPEPAVTE